MNLLRKLKFALQYDFYPEFIVVPFGEGCGPCKFLKYEDAMTSAEKEVKAKPMYGKPSVLVVVWKRGK